MWPAQSKTFAEYLPIPVVLWKTKDWLMPFMMMKNCYIRSQLLLRVILRNHWPHSPRSLRKLKTDHRKLRIQIRQSSLYILHTILKMSPFCFILKSSFNPCLISRMIYMSQLTTSESQLKICSKRLSAWISRNMYAIQKTLGMLPDISLCKFQEAYQSFSSSTTSLGFIAGLALLKNMFGSRTLQITQIISLLLITLQTTG